jgi:hypothetical protein
MPVHLYKGTEIIMGSVPHGADLIDFLTGVCVERGITVGVISVIGSVTVASIAFYDQKTHVYSDVAPAPGQMEIVSGSGNISLRDGKPFPHLHVVLSGPSGECVAGHVNRGTKIFAAEFSIARLEGPALTRGPDKVTGLNLWVE